MEALAGYTVPVENRMRLRHDAQVRFTVTSSRTTLEDHLISVEGVSGAVTVAGVTYNRAAYSGGVSWWNPETGKPIARPKIRMRVREQDVLSGEQECECPRCSS